MDSRHRFLETLNWGKPDRIPLFDEGIRDDVLDNWHLQGMSVGLDHFQEFNLDYRKEIDINLGPLPYPRKWPSNLDELSQFQKRFDTDDLRRFPKDWNEQVAAWQVRDYPLILRVHDGFFLTLGIDGWDRFHEAMYKIFDQPGLVSRLLQMQGELSAKITDWVLSQISVDAVLFSEPIGGNHGSLISPAMYQKLVIPTYEPIIEVVHKHRIPNVIMRTYANSRVLLPEWLMLGVNCLWAVEVPPGSDMDYRCIRRDFGKELSLVGGIDLDALSGNENEILEALRPVSELLSHGGYIPLLDGRIRSDVSWKNYCFFREQLARILANQ